MIFPQILAESPDPEQPTDNPALQYCDIDQAAIAGGGEIQERVTDDGLSGTNQVEYSRVAIDRGNGVELGAVVQGQSYSQSNPPSTALSPSLISLNGNWPDIVAIIHNHPHLAARKAIQTIDIPLTETGRRRTIWSRAAPIRTASSFTLLIDGGRCARSNTSLQTKEALATTTSITDKCRGAAKMSLIGLMLLISVQTSDIYLREAPAPNWSARSNAVQCGLLEAEVSHKSSRKAKRPDKLKGEVRYLKQKRDLSVEMDQIADQIESVYDLGISCPADNRVKITIIGNTSAGEKSFEIYINDRLEVEVYSYDGNRFEDR